MHSVLMPFQPVGNLGIDGSLSPCTLDVLPVTPPKHLQDQSEKANVRECACVRIPTQAAKTIQMNAE